MKLYYTPARNLVPTIDAIVNYADLGSSITAMPVDAVDPESELGRANPLGRLPALLLDDGQCLAGSALVGEYLDSLHKRRKLYPAKGPQRWLALRQASVAEGLHDAVAAIAAEASLPRDQQRAPVVQRNWALVTRALDQLEREVLAFTRIDIAQFRTVAALQYLKVRLPEIATQLGLDPRFDFTQGRPHLAAWFKSMSRKKIFRTALPAQ